ncbi:MAG: hypothetical protein WCP35_08255 [Verrucomicrobiota bacterium]
MDSGNSAFRSVGGFLFDHDITTLIRYPAGIPGGSHVFADPDTQSHPSRFYRLRSP